MDATGDSLLRGELCEFSSHNWVENCEFTFASLSLTIKRNNEGQWYLRHTSKVEAIVDSAVVPAENFTALNRYDHFLQVRNGSFSCLFLFVPSKSLFIKLEGLSGAYVKAEKYTRIFTHNMKVSGIENLDFTINPSEFVGIYGESGIGKSVLINSILGTIQEGKVKGTLLIEDGYGERIPQDDIAYLPQIVDIPQYLSCIEILQAAMVDRSTNGLCNVLEIKEALIRCSLDESILYKKYRQISEGQKRRLNIAATLLKKHSKILIADEPTTGLDVYSEKQVMETLRSISRSGITVVVITHSVISAPIMDRVLVLKKVANNRGATICYDGPVCQERLDIISDTLGGINDSQEQEHRKAKNGYLFPVMFAQKQHDKGASVTRNFAGTCKLVLYQGAQWCKNILKVVFRDWKSIVVFGVLTIVCALAIQFGTNSNNGNNPENILLTLFSLAAPWLCAMFAAISVSELNRYFAWEHFSGLRSAAFLSGTVFAHAATAFCIALIFTIGLFVSPRNCEIVKRWICRGVSQDTANEVISDRLWFVKGVHNVPQTETVSAKTEESIQRRMEEREQEIKKVKEDRLEYISTCRDYASRPVEITDWYTPLKRGDAFGLDKAVAYSPILTLYDALKATPLDNGEVPAIRGNYPLTKGKARSLPQSVIYIFFVVLFLMWVISWIGSIIGITSAIILGNAKNAAVSIIVIFIFYILFSRIFISSYEAMSYLQPLAEISTNLSTIDFQDLGIIIPICCSFICLGRYASNLLAYAFTEASLSYDIMALCGMALFCLLLSFVVLTRKKNV